MESNKITVYEVWTEGTGDNFKGWNNIYKGTFKSEDKAEEAARKCYGWVEPNTGIFHKDFKFND